MKKIETYRIRNVELTKEDLLFLDKDILRALIHERAHHTVEVPIYPILEGKRKAPPNFGNELKILLEIWKERKLPMDGPNMKWAKRYLDLAEKVNRGEVPNLDTNEPEPFTKEELKAVDKLIFNRRSIRQWKNNEVPKWMIDRIIEAGIAAPNACNMQCQRFLVLDDKEIMSIIKGDVGLPPLKIVICQDMRIFDWMGQTKMAPQNIYFDAAAAADHMCLMAHALGLGAIWLTHTQEQAEKLRKHLALPEYLRMDTHIALGWPDEAPIKSGRMPIEDVLIKPKK